MNGWTRSDLLCVFSAIQTEVEDNCVFYSQPFPTLNFTQFVPDKLCHKISTKMAFVAMRKAPQHP